MSAMLESTTISTLTLPEHVHQIADTLPPGATWDDVRYQIELRASVEQGLADSRAGRLIPVEELLREFGLAE